MQNLIFKVFPQSNFIDLSLYQFGREYCSPAQSFGPAARNHYLFHYVISGSGTLHATDSNGKTKTYKLSANEGFLLFPGQVSIYLADEETPWKYMWVEFDGFQVKAALDTCGRTEDNPVFTFPSRERREQIFNEMTYLIQNKDAPPLSLLGHTYLFLDQLTRREDRAPEEGYPPPAKYAASRFYINEAVTYIKANYQRDISIEEVADKCGLSRAYFGKVFKEHFGKSPQDFLMNFRMQKATELLSNTALTIGEVSSSVGYVNQLHFSRAFKNRYGISPRQWRDTYANPKKK